VLTRNGATTYLSEVAHVRDGFSPQTNIVRQNGERGVLVSVIKNGGSSTLDIVNSLLAQLPIVEQILPKDLKITPLFDQSGFVQAAISAVVREALIAACLTAALILVFLGNWRSTCIIAVSIPLSILSSIIALYVMGETLNIMTLGGLALAVGILVDDATVTIENIERHMHMGSDLHKAILEGAGEMGRDFFPSVDGGQIRLHMRLPTGTRIEETARVADEVEGVIRTLVPAAELGTVLDNLGVAVSGRRCRFKANSSPPRFTW
jgi:multidrug efflux pump subunit AcrB